MTKYFDYMFYYSNKMLFTISFSKTNTLRIFILELWLVITQIVQIRKN